MSKVESLEIGKNGAVFKPIFCRPMSRILSIDSSIPSGSVALVDSTQVLSQKLFSKDLPSSKSILSSIDQLFTDSQTTLGEVDGFCITTGPGSFTGLRVGVSLVKGFVLGTQKPFLGVDTLEALAGQVEPCHHLICPLLDARKKEVYAAFFKYKGNRLVRQSPDETISPEVLANKIFQPTYFIGQGAEVHRDYLSQRLGSKFIREGKVRIDSSAASAGILAGTRFDAEKNHDLNRLRINYIRKSEAENQNKR